MENIVERVKKLLNMSRDNGASEQEAETAMRKAHALLAEHNLSLQDISESDKTIIEKGFIDSGHGDWRGWLWVRVSALYFCFYYSQQCYSPSTGKPSKRRVVIGQDDNIKIVAEMVSYLTGAIEHIASVECKGKGRSFHSQFKKGMANRLCIRIREQMEAAKAGTVQSSTGTSMVLASLYEKAEIANKAHVKESGVKLKETGARIRLDAGYAAGDAAGKSFNMNKPLNGSTNVRGQLV